MFVNCPWKWSLSASGWWTVLGWVVFALKGNLLILIPKTPKTDWPSFEFWFWLLLITLFKSCLFVFRVTNAGIVIVIVVDWDGTGTATDLKPHIGLEAVMCFCLKKKSGVFLKSIFTVFTPARFVLGWFCTEIMCKQMMPNGNRRGNGYTIMMSWTKDMTISNVVAFTETFTLRPGRIISLFECGSIFSLQSVLLWYTVFLIVFWVKDARV